MTNTRQPIDPASLVPGARVTIEGTVVSVGEDQFSVRMSPRHVVIFEAEWGYPLITSVTLPPTDWSKVKRARWKADGSEYDLVAAGNMLAILRAADGNEFPASFGSLTPLPDEPSAGEASEQDKAIADAMAFGTSVLRDGKHVKPEDMYADTRPAWQQASVGDVVSVRAKVVEVDDDSDDHPEFRLNFGGCKILAGATDILDIVEKADADANR